MENLTHTENNGGEATETCIVSSATGVAITDKKRSKGGRYRLHLNNITFTISNFRSKRCKDAE